MPRAGRCPERTPQPLSAHAVAADREVGKARAIVSMDRSLLPNNAMVTTIDPGFNRLMSPWDYGGQNLLYGWAYPVSGGVLGIPSKLHVVGNAINRWPLQLGIPGRLPWRLREASRGRLRGRYGLNRLGHGRGPRRVLSCRAVQYEHPADRPLLRHKR